METATRNTEGSIGKRLLQALLTELKMQSPRFNTLNEQLQGEVIDRLRCQVDDAVRDAVQELAAGKNDAIRVTIEQVSFKKGVKIVLSGVATQGAFLVAAEVGRPSLLVLCDPDAHVGDMRSVTPTPSQSSLLGDAAPKPPADDGSDAGGKDDDDDDDDDG